MYTRQTRVELHLFLLACVYIYRRGRYTNIGTPLRFTRRFTSRLGGRFISTLMSQLEAAGLPLLRKRGPVWFPRTAPECPLRESFLNPMISLALPRSPVISDRVSNTLVYVCGASTTRIKRKETNKHQEESVSNGSFRRVGANEMKRKSRAKIVINIAERVA